MTLKQHLKNIGKIRSAKKAAASRVNGKLGGRPKKQKMKALSIKQPWAWLIVNGHKNVENRDWQTKRRGKILVHASKKVCPAGIQRAKELGITLPETLELGGIVGETEIVDCVETSSSPWFEGKFGFMLANSRPLPFQPMKGMLSFFEVER